MFINSILRMSSKKIYADLTNRYAGAGWHFEKRGKYEAALKFYILALKHSIVAYGANSINASMHHERIAHCYDKLDNTQKKMEHLRQSQFSKK